MQLYGQAHDQQYSMAGKYTKEANGLSSGMPYWTSSEGTKALWFTNGQWRIGKKSDLGTTTQGLHSTFSPSCPESIGSNWKYNDGEEWLAAHGNANMYKYKGMTIKEINNSYATIKNF